MIYKVSYILHGTGFQTSRARWKTQPSLAILMFLFSNWMSLKKNLWNQKTQKIPLDSWLHGQDGHHNKATGATNHQGAAPVSRNAVTPPVTPGVVRCFRGGDSKRGPKTWFHVLHGEVRFPVLSRSKHLKRGRWVCGRLRRNNVPLPQHKSKWIPKTLVANIVNAAFETRNFRDSKLRITPWNKFVSCHV